MINPVDENEELPQEVCRMTVIISDLEDSVTYEFMLHLDDEYISIAHLVALQEALHEGVRRIDQVIEDVQREEEDDNWGED